MRKMNVTKKSPAIPRGAKAARKSSALIIAEANIRELKDDVRSLWRLAVVSLGFIITTLVAVVGFLLAPFFHHP